MTILMMGGYGDRIHTYEKEIIETNTTLTSSSKMNSRQIATSSRALRNRSVRANTPLRNRSVRANERKSLQLLHQSISFYIPVGELDSTSDVVTNPYIDFHPSVFCITYLDSDETLNPESLQLLSELTNKKLSAYVVGYMFDLNYENAQLRCLEESVTSALVQNFPTPHGRPFYRCQVTTLEDFAPTENDSRGLMINVTGVREEREVTLYQAYILSWCSPVIGGDTMLPLMLCRGSKKYTTVINKVLSQSFNCNITRLGLTQENFLHVLTYALIMLDKNDNYKTTFSYRISPGVINVSVCVESLLKLWKKIHKDDSTNVDLAEVMLFNNALETFFESVYRLQFGLANLEKIKVTECFSLKNNSEMWFKSTKIIHVVLKYLTYIAIQRLRIKTNEENNSIASK